MLVSPYWHEQLDREINRAEKADYDSSLMEISLNRFKEYNSMYGHLKGDQLLTEIPSALTDSPGARFGWKFRLGVDISFPYG